MSDFRAEDLKKSKELIGELLPVIKDQHGKILDGFHRKEIDPNWKETVVEVKDPLQALLIRVHSNIVRRTVEDDEKRAWVKEARAIFNQQNLRDGTEREIAEILGVSQHFVHEYDELVNVEPMGSTFQPQLYNVWNIPALDQRFGTYGYPGQTPGQYVQNVLYYFTNENDLVVDPCAGGGTTIDVCKAMNRRCLGYDISPSREDIKQNDITDGYPVEAKDCDLIYLDPPYFDAMYDTQFWESKEDYLKFLESLAKHSFETVKKNGIVTLLIMDLEARELRGCWSVYAAKIFLDVGFYPERHVSVPLTTEQFSPFDVERAKKERFMLGRNRSLFIFKKVI